VQEETWLRGSMPKSAIFRASQKHLTAEGAKKIRASADAALSSVHRIVVCFFCDRVYSALNVTLAFPNGFLTVELPLYS
jgi:hypothetical protein